MLAHWILQHFGLGTLSLSEALASGVFQVNSSHLLIGLNMTPSNNGVQLVHRRIGGCPEVSHLMSSLFLGELGLVTTKGNRHDGRSEKGRKLSNLGILTFFYVYILSPVLGIELLNAS